MPRKPPLTPEQHYEIGRRLSAIRDELFDLVLLVQPHVGQARLRPLLAALAAVDSARSKMSGIFHIQHARAFTLEAYFPVRNPPLRTNQPNPRVSGSS